MRGRRPATSAGVWDTFSRSVPVLVPVPSRFAKIPYLIKKNHGVVPHCGLFNFLNFLMDLNGRMYDARQPSVPKIMICPVLYTAHCSVHLKVADPNPDPSDPFVFGPPGS